MNDDNIYAPPKSELIDENKVQSEPDFFPTSMKKLIILYFATFGLYPVYWFYKQWKYQQNKTGEKMLPVMRAIFLIFFTHSLFRRVADASDEKNIERSWNGNGLATIYVILVILSNILENISRHSEELTTLDLVSLFLVFPLVVPIYMVQKVINKINDDPEGKLNNRFSAYNFIFIVLGVIWWLLILIGLQVINVDAVLQNV